MTDQPSGLDCALSKIQAAIADIPVEGFDAADLADALLAMSINVGSKLVDERTLARVHLGIAEHLFDLCKQGDQPAAQASVATDSHAFLTGAVQALRDKGHDDFTIRHHMLAFAIAWVRSEEGPAGAEMIYRHADAVVASGRTSH